MHACSALDPCTLFPYLRRSRCTRSTRVPHTYRTQVDDPHTGRRDVARAQAQAPTALGRASCVGRIDSGTFASPPRVSPAHSIRNTRAACSSPAFLRPSCWPAAFHMAVLRISVRSFLTSGGTCVTCAGSARAAMRLQRAAQHACSCETSSPARDQSRAHAYAGSYQVLTPCEHAVAACGVAAQLTLRSSSSCPRHASCWKR